MRLSFSLLLIILLAVSFTAAGCENIDKSILSNKNSIAKERSAEENKRDEGKAHTKIVTQKFPSFADLIESLKPSVVNISTTGVISQRGPFDGMPRSPFGENHPFDDFFKRFFGEREYRHRGLGSGFVISSDGYVVTNNHVIQNAEDIEVVLQSGDKYKAKIIGKDPKTDLAVLKIEPDKELHAVRFGDSDKLRIGDWVIAIGNPLGFGYTVTTGIVSAKGRSLGLSDYEDFIQTDASLNPGNSGGPLFNLNGDVVGINTAIARHGQGIGFSIPVSMAESVIEQLKNKGSVVRGWLGIYVQPLTPDIAASFGIKENEGALVSDVMTGSPAEKAGIERGNVIIEFNGNKVKDVTDVRTMAASTSPETEVNVKLISNGKMKNVRVKLGKLPEDEREAQTQLENKERIGLTVREITPNIAERFNLSDTRGVIVAGVERGSIAAYAGIRPGDVILEIDKKPIENLKNYASAIDSVKSGGTALFLIRRGESTFYMTIRVEGSGKDSEKK